MRWGAKFNGDGLVLGLATPETAAHFVISPGAGSGGVGIESSPLANHFVTLGGLPQAEPAEAMERLRQTLDFKNQPQTVLYAIQPRD